MRSSYCVVELGAKNLGFYDELNSMHLLATIFIWIGLILVGFGIIFAIKSVIERSKLTPKADWPQVPGEVTTSKVVEKASDGETDSLTMFAAHISFRFEFGGHPFECSTLDGDAFYSSNRKSAEELVAEYPNGKKLSMLIPPHSPSSARPVGWKPGAQIGVIIGIALTAVGSILGAAGWLIK
jgi:hypothetical protein